MRKKTAFAIFLLGCRTILAQSPEIAVPIINADFEAQDVTGGAKIQDPPGCGTQINEDRTPGWTFEHVLGGSGGGVAHWTCDDGVPPSNVAFLGYGERMYQLTGEKARQGSYVLQFDCSNWFYSYPGDWKAELYQATADASGNVSFSPAPFCSGSGWNLGDMRRKTVSCDMPGYFLQVTSLDPLSVGGQKPGGYVAIVLTSGVPNPALGGHAQWPIKIDNVSLKFSPQR